MTQIPIGLRQGKQLCQMNHDELISFIAEGLTTILDSANSFTVAGKLITHKCSREVYLLENIAMEEASKILILLDVVRCPKNLRSNRLGSVIQNFYSHFARSIYDNAISWKPTDFEMLKSYVMQSSRSHYVVDEIGEHVLPNDANYMREANLYADIGSDGENLYWHSPINKDHTAEFETPKSVKLANSMMKLGLLSEQGVKLIAEAWDGTNFSCSETSSQCSDLIYQTLEYASEEGLFQESAEQDDVQCVMQGWQIPMYNIDFKIIPVEADEIQRERDGRLYSWLGNP